MSDTCGPNGSDSSKNADRPSSSESKSRPRKSSVSKEADAAYQRKYRMRHPAKNLIRHAKLRATKKGMPFDLTEHLEELEARIQKGVCEVSGLPFNLTNGRTWDSPSLDRIEPTKGYVYANVRVVCHAVNCAMGDWGDAKMLEIARAILQRRQQASNALSIQLGQNLMRSLEGRGSPEYSLTWNQSVTPAGHVYYRLRASGRRTSGNGCTGWPTPRTVTGGAESGERKQELGRTESGGGDLQAAAFLAGWPTPCQQDGPKGGPAQGTDRLPAVAHLAGWATPGSGDDRGPNPKWRESAARHAAKGVNKQMGLRDQVLGVDPSGSPASTASSGESPPTKRATLNPAFSRWLMGFPPEWDRCAPTQKPSRSRPARRRGLAA